MYSAKGDASSATSALRIGAHLSINKGYESLTNVLQELEATTAQLFFKSPQASKAWKKVLDPSSSDIINAKKNIASRGYFIISHSQYTLNFTRTLAPKYQWQLGSLINDLENCTILGMYGTVIHCGSNVENKNDKDMYASVASYIKKAIATVPGTAKVIIEIQALSGTHVIGTIDHIKTLLMLMSSAEIERIGVCIDTQHASVNGSVFRDKKTVQEYFAEFEKKLGIERLSCIHFNDAKSFTKDCHEDILYGLIWDKGLGGSPEGLVELLRYCTKKNIPMILETPAEHAPYDRQIAVSKLLAGATDKAVDMIVSEYLLQ